MRKKKCNVFSPKKDIFLNTGYINNSLEAIGTGNYDADLKILFP